MWRLVAIGAGWATGLAALALAAWLAVDLGVVPALAVGLVAGLALRAAWRRSREAVEEPMAPGAARSRDGARSQDAAPRREDAAASVPIPVEGTAPQPGTAPREGDDPTRLGAPAAPEPVGSAPPRSMGGMGSPRRRAVAVVLAAAGAGLAVLVSLALILSHSVGEGFIAPSHPGAAPPPPGAASIYRAAGELGPARNVLTLRERYAVAVSELEGSPDLEAPEGLRPEEGRFFVPEGWEGELVRDSVVLTRTRTVEADISLLRMSSIVALDVPRVSYLGLVLWARPGSRVELDLPRHFLVTTFPPLESTVDLVDARRWERTSIPVTIAAGDSREIRLKVLHPLLRHGVGESVTRASILAPVKWAVLALVAIFAEQIKRRLLVPLAGRMAALLRLPLFKEEGERTA
jgi:hypothetical protein